MPKAKCRIVAETRAMPGRKSILVIVILSEAKNPRSSLACSFPWILRFAQDDGSWVFPLVVLCLPFEFGVRNLEFEIFL